MPHYMRHFIWVFTVFKSTRLGVSPHTKGEHVPLISIYSSLFLESVYDGRPFTNVSVINKYAQGYQTAG